MTRPPSREPIAGYSVIPAGEVPHPACVWGRSLAHDEDANCNTHPDRPAVAELYYPTRMACAECYGVPPLR